MAIRKQKLELTWIGKEIQPKLEPRILIEDPEKSYGKLTPRPLSSQERGADRRGEFDNMLIYGDNLLALKALEQEFAGKVKCVYIDPPFNTGQAFETYDDGLEHSIWLNLISQRARQLHKLLSDDGTLFVHIDDNELGYLIVILDEIFGRQNRAYTVTFKQGSATGHKSINPGCVSTTNYVLIYAKNRLKWKPRRVFTAIAKRDNRYAQYISNIDEDFSKWELIPLLKAFADSVKTTIENARKIVKRNSKLLDEFVINNPERVVRPARPDYEGVGAKVREIIDLSKKHPDKFHLLQRDGYSPMYLKNGERLLFYTDKLKEIDGEKIAGEPLTTLWDDILSNNLHNEGDVSFPKGKKPEFLLKRIFDLASEPGDLVLDSFLGSGTTAAVAHKMGRRWIGIELGEHCHTHCIPRLKKVCDGTDQGGISKSVNWKGGGGFRYYYLAPSLLKKDKYGNWIIDERYNPDMLAAAMAKHEGFRFSPDEECYWKQGRSTEKDCIFTTTMFVTIQFLDKIHEEMKPEESLLICCKSYAKACEGRYTNITVRKIPKMLLGRCEFGKEDYSLNIVNMPRDPNAPDFEPVGPEPHATSGKLSRKKAKMPEGQTDLFELTH